MLSKKIVRGVMETTEVTNDFALCSHQDDIVSLGYNPSLNKVSLINVKLKYQSRHDILNKKKLTNGGK